MHEQRVGAGRNEKLVLEQDWNEARLSWTVLQFKKAWEPIWRFYYLATPVNCREAMVIEEAQVIPAIAPST